MADDNYPTWTHAQADAQARANPGQTLFYRVSNGEGYSVFLDRTTDEIVKNRITGIDKT